MRQQKKPYRAAKWMTTEQVRVQESLGYMSWVFGQPTRFEDSLRPDVDRKEAQNCFHLLWEGNTCSDTLLKAFDKWLVTFVKPEERTKIQNSITVRTRRAMGRGGVTVTLSEKAHQMLSELARLDGTGMSEVIESRLARQFRAATKKQSQP